MQLSTTIETSNNVRYIKTLENGDILLLDENNIFSILVLIDDWQISKTAKYSQLPENIDNHIDISSDGLYIAMVSSCKQKVYIYNLFGQNKISTIKIEDDAINKIIFIDNNNKLLVSTKNGKTHIFVVSNSKFVKTLKEFHSKEVITSCANKKYICTVGADNKLLVFKIKNKENCAIFVRNKYHKSDIKFVHFIDDHRIVSVDKDGHLVFWDVLFEDTIGSLQITKTPNSISFFHNNMFMFVGCVDSRFVLLIDTFKMKILNREYIANNKNFLMLSFMPSLNKLAIANEKSINLYSLLNNKQELEQLLEDRKFTEFNLQITKNPLITAYSTYKKYTNAWFFVYSKTFELEKKRDSKQAKQLSAFFSNIPKKGHLIREIHKDYKIFEKFIISYKSQSYRDMYDLATKHKELKQTIEYENVENKFNKLIQQAFYILKHMQVGSDGKLKIHFYKFLNVSSKSNIINRFLFIENNILSLFHLMSNGKFRQCFKIIKAIPIIKSTNSYDAIAAYFVYWKKRYYKNLFELNLADSRSSLDILSQFINHEQQLEQFNRDYFIFNEMNANFLNKNLSNMLQLTMKYPILNNTKIIRHFKHRWLKDYSTAKFHAKNRNIIKLLSTMKFYIIKNVYIEKIAVTICRCYIEQILNIIEYLINKKNEHLVESYMVTLVHIFGKNRLIKYCIKCFKAKYNITIVIPNDKQDFIKWKDLKLPNIIYQT